MMSLRALGNLSGGGSSAKLAATYYQEHSADYYVEDLDHRGQWMGQGAKELGLEGAVDRQEFQLALAGYVAGEEVQNAGKENRQMGWDLTFSAPKSVSIVWAGAKGDLRQEIEIAHQRAIQGAFAYLEEHTTTRRGQGGVIHEQASLVASRFNHYTSREGDPQLHSHVVVANFSVRNDGTVGTIDSRTFYQHKMAAGALYQVELAWGMRNLGYKIEPGSKGTFRLKDVKVETERLFSKRDKQIDDLVSERGIKSYAGTRGIVLATRADKVNSNLLEREETWGKEARENSVGLNVERGSMKFEPVKSNHQIMMEACQKLTAQHSTFKENVLLRETAVASLGERSGLEVRELVTAAQKKDYVVCLADGLLTTPDMAKIEQGIMGQVKRMVGREGCGVNADKAIEHGAGNIRKFAFSEEQEIAIRVATGNSALAVIQGRAGVGKSTMLSAVRHSYEQQDWKVQGIALAGAAAANLQKESGIESKTIASWLPQKELDKRTVVIMDEAGMVGSKQMFEVIQKIEQKGAKLVLVGDDRQLQPIAAGGIFHAIDREVAKIAPQYSTVVEDIKRQKEPWMKDVVKTAAQGRTGEVLESLDRKGKIEVYQNAQQARSALIEEFIAKNSQDFTKGLIITHRTHDAQKINEEIREKLQTQGVIEKKGVEFANDQRNIVLAKGDRVIFNRNDYDLEVRNGQRAMVNKVSSLGIIDVAFDNGEKKQINVKKYSHLDYGWASTTHKAQGVTVDKAIVYGFSDESMASAQATYVQISRAREETKLFIVAGERSVEREGGSLKIEAEQHKEALEEMKKSWSYNAAKDTTLEHVSSKQPKEIIQKFEMGLEMGQ